ncbi:DMT family transporter [Lutispora sp.]|uniref:DMT family transporter n=1 Tax=Lutispora sp. TaxID=2828727 RepID=UPI002B21B497|nr:DMT family transporter [Lutispora sp.]MEA4961007.1 DMT family transporter [Lutispora sp.]
MQSHIGEMAALVTAICWTINAIAFESAGKKVGSMSVNYIRLFIAFFLLGICSFISRGIALPVDATAHTWFWLLISGLIGFVLGDLFLFQAYVEIGSRISLLIMSAAPPITALAGFLIMGEKISILGLAGMFITMGGICLVILSRNPAEKKIRFNRPVKGIAYACIGALGQAFGLIFSKLGMGSYNPFAATQIRLIAAFIGFTVIITMKNKWPEIRAAFEDRKAIGQIAIGAVFGPFSGVTFSLLAVQYTATGIVSSITSVSPVLIIPISIMIFKEKILPKEIAGAFISIAGVILLFL